MDLNEYIKMSYERPNRKVLEGLGASEDLIEYLMETPGNTNWNVLSSLSPSSGDEPEVWLVGDTGVESQGMMVFELSNVDATDHITELFTNAENYKLFLNGEELPYFYDMSGDPAVKEYFWFDKQHDSQPTKQLILVRQPGESDIVAAGYTDASTAPTSVEVSVKAK